MTIALSANTPRVSYTVAQGATQTAFTVNFEFFDEADLNFYVDGTLKTISTHYTVSGGDGSTGTINTTSGNSVLGATGGSTVVITRDIALARVTDFPSSGAFEVATLNTELDRFTAIASDLNDSGARGIRLQDFDSAVSMELPLLDSRKGTVLGFNATTGAVEAGPIITAVQSLSAVTASINLLGTSAVVEDMGLLATSAVIEDMGLLATSGNVTAMGLLGVSSVITDMGILGTAAIVEDMGFLGTSANVTAMGHLGTSANVTAMGKLGNDATVADMAILGTDDVVADMNTLATSDIIADLNTLATSDIVTDMNLLATSANVTAMGHLGTSANVTAMGLLGTSAVVTDLDLLGTSANVTAMGHLGTSANVTAMGLLGTSAVVTDLGILGTAAIVEDMGILATSANVTAMGLLGTSAVVEDMGLLGTAAVVEDLGLLATSAVIEDMGLLATSANVTNMATLGASGVVDNIATVATGISGVNSFAARYRVASSDPSSDNDEGDLFYNTSDNTFKFFNGSSFVAVNVSGIDNIVEDTSPQLGGNLDGQDKNITTTGVGTFASLDISGDVDVDGTLEADAITIGGVTLAETISDTVGAMVTSNTESGITVAYDDSDNTLDFTVGTLNQNTTGNAATATALATARTIGGTSFDGTANIAVGLADTATVLATARTIGGVSFNGSANINLPGVNTGGNQATTGNAATATKLATARTINGTSFDGTGNITISAGKVLQCVSDVKTDTFSTATTSAAGVEITGLTQSITPSATNHKVLVMVFLGAIGCSTSSSRSITFVLQRGASQIAIGDASGSRPRVTSRSWMTSGDTNHALGGHSIVFLDDPGTTSAVTYSVHMSGTHDGATAYINRTGADSNGGNNYQSRTMSTITCMEISD